MSNKTTELPPMKLAIETYVIEKVKKDDAVINIPMLPIYTQSYNHRIMIGIFPQAAEWNNGGIWELQVILIDEDDCIRRTFIRISDLSSIASNFNTQGKGADGHLKDEVVRYLMDYYGKDTVSKEVFQAKFDRSIEKMKSYMQ